MTAQNEATPAASPAIEPAELSAEPLPVGEGAAAVSADSPTTDARAEKLSGADLLVREGDVAGDYLEQLLDVIDFDGDIDMDVEGDRAAVAIVGDNLGALIGPRGTTLDALQELTRLAVVQQTGVRSRLMLDIGGYRAQRRLDLLAVGKNAAERVKANGDPVSLEPMNPFERKVVHDAVSQIQGVRSESEGEEPDRRVVVLPAT